MKTILNNKLPVIKEITNEGRCVNKISSHFIILFHIVRLSATTSFFFPSYAVRHTAAIAKKTRIPFADVFFKINLAVNKTMELFPNY